VVIPDPPGALRGRGLRAAAGRCPGYHRERAWACCGSDQLRLPDPEQREFYGRLAATDRWSSPPSDVFKDPYILDFLGLEDTYSERDLEAAILRNSERFLLEVGTDCCFVARQRRLTIDGEDYHIDLVFYHRSLRCLVLVDLKLGAFAPADAAQMQLYLEWSKRHDRRAGEEEPIGLILCGSHGEQVVELLLSSQTNRMRVAQYLLPEDTAALKARLAQITAAYEGLHGGAADGAKADEVGR